MTCRSWSGISGKFLVLCIGDKLIIYSAWSIYQSLTTSSVSGCPWRRGCKQSRGQFFFFLKEKSSPVGGRGVQTSRSKVCRELSFVITGRRIAFYEPNPTGRRRDMDDLKQNRSQFEVGVCKGFGMPCFLSIDKLWAHLPFVVCTATFICHHVNVLVDGSFS